MADIKGQLLPVYIAADESGSMEPQAGELDAGMTSLHRALRGDPMVAAKMRLTVLGFSDRVSLRLPLADIRETPTPPRMRIGGTTSYRAVFEDLIRRIPADVEALKKQDYIVHRPVVFFLSDGAPNQGEDWTTPHATLTNRATTQSAPNIIACGVGDADAATILKVATQSQFAFVSMPGADIGAAISKFFIALTTSIVVSVPTFSTQNPTLVIDRPEQFTMAIDVV